MSEPDAKYGTLCNILDGYVSDGAASKSRSIYVGAADSDQDRDQARSRAFIHLFLEAKYGMHDFGEREYLITDKSNDGGIDAYYIDHDQSQIVLVQSKFRTNAKNFTEKSISIDEISRVDADRILSGRAEDAEGNKYNGKISQLQREVANIKGLPFYSHKIVVLANVRENEQRAVAKILQPLPVEIYNFSRCYEELVVPILRGEQTYYADFHLNIDMSNKSAGSRLTANIQTQHGPAEITVILAPTLEIAKAMSRYRNSILRYNPRSYLEFHNQSTNSQIRHSIVARGSGEFALLNNGITILSDETRVTDLTGKADTAQVLVRNPQIINGGQTAFTLSRVFDDLPADQREQVFRDKEVVVRIITLANIAADKKLELIKEISSATNSQTQVVAADRILANDDQRALATRIFMAHGLLYEHKRGEYADATRRGYIDTSQIIERSLFLRLMLLAGGSLEKATRGKSMRRGLGFKGLDTSDPVVTRFGCVHAVYRCVQEHPNLTMGKIAGSLAAVEAAMTAIDMGLRPELDTVGPIVASVAEIWPELEDWCMEHNPNRGGNKRNGPFTSERWARSRGAKEDIRAYLETFGLGPSAPAGLSSGVSLEIA